MKILGQDMHCSLLKSEQFPSILRVKVVLLAPYWAVSATYLGHDKMLHATFP